MTPSPSLGQRDCCLDLVLNCPFGGKKRNVPEPNHHVDPRQPETCEKTKQNTIKPPHKTLYTAIAWPPMLVPGEQTLLQSLDVYIYTELSGCFVNHSKT